MVHKKICKSYYRAKSLESTSTITITDHNGIDITSSIQMMVYTGTLQFSESNNSLIDRQADPVHYINDCLPNDAFKESRCTPYHGRMDSLQSWTKTCYRFVTQYDMAGVPNGSNLRQYDRDGHCAPEEVCMNTVGQSIAGKPGPRMAMCVAKSEFQATIDRTKSGFERFLDLALKIFKRSDGPLKQEKNDGGGDEGNGSSTGVEGGHGSIVSLVMSQIDGGTPIEVDTFEVGAWTDADRQMGDKKAVQSKKCRDCLDLEIDKLAPDPEHLKLEATMLTAGAIAGILWVGIMSG